MLRMGGCGGGSGTVGNLMPAPKPHEVPGQANRCLWMEGGCWVKTGAAPGTGAPPSGWKGHTALTSPQLPTARTLTLAGPLRVWPAPIWNFTFVHLGIEEGFHCLLHI